MDARKRAAYLFWLAIAVVPIFGLVWSVMSPQDFEVWQSVARDAIARFGVFGPLVFVLIQALQVVVTPISHYTVGAIGGYLYGPYFGGVLNYVGRIIGHICAFEIARRLGRPFLASHLDVNTLRRYDRIVGDTAEHGVISRLQTLILFLIYFLPLFPDDEISYLVGASSMGRKSFLLANLFGHLGGAFSLAYLGSGVSTSDPLFWVLTLSTLAGFPAILAAFRFQSKRRQENMGTME